MTSQMNITRGPQDRRRFSRVRVGVAAQMTAAADADVLELVDLGHTGCAVESREAFNPGDELHLTFTVNTCLSFVVPVWVMYARTAQHPRPAGFPHLIGFSFVVARQPDIHRIVEILLEAAEQPLSVH